MLQRFQVTYWVIGVEHNCRKQTARGTDVWAHPTLARECSLEFRSAT